MIFHKADLQKFSQERRQRDALPGQFDRWLKQLGPRQLPILFVNRFVAAQLPGNADPLAACNVQVGNGAAALKR